MAQIYNDFRPPQGGSPPGPFSAGGGGSVPDPLVINDLTVNVDATVGNNLTAGTVRTATILNNLGVTVTISDNLSVTGNANVGGTLNAINNVDVGGSVQIDGDLHGDGNGVFDGDLSCGAVLPNTGLTTRAFRSTPITAHDFAINPAIVARESFIVAFTADGTYTLPAPGNNTIGDMYIFVDSTGNGGGTVLLDKNGALPFPDGVDPQPIGVALGTGPGNFVLRLYWGGSSWFYW